TGRQPTRGRPCYKAGMLPGAEAETLLEPGPLRRLLAGFPALRHRNFRLFVVGQGISLVGFWMQSVAQGWLVYRLEGRPLDLGKVAVAGYLPILCLAPFAGVVADRLPRRRVLLVTQALLGLLALALGVLVWTGAVTVPLVVLYAGGVGLVSPLDVPTRQSFLVEMASPGDLPNAIALTSSIFSGARLVGPALAGALVAALGEAPCFFLNAASYVAVLVALALMRLQPSERPRTAQALGAGFVSGLRYVWGAPAIRNLLLLLGVVSGLGVQYNLLMPVFARTVLETNAFGYGLLHTAGGIGAIAAALQLAARRYSRAQHRRHLLLGLTTFALAVLGLAASRRLALALRASSVTKVALLELTGQFWGPVLRHDDKRQRILAAATAVFAERDFHRVLVSEVATRAGVGKGTVYLYFPTKDRLHRVALEASLERVAGEVERAAEADAPAEVVLREIVVSILRFFWRRPHL